MPFKTHTEGGIWTGGGTDVPNCNPTEINAIRSALVYCLTSAVPCLRSLRGLEDLAHTLSFKDETNLLLDCKSQECNGVTARINARGGNEITLCDTALPPIATQEETDVALFHQMILACKGTAFDAWALENHCYHGHGTVMPPVHISNGTFVETTIEVARNLRASEFLLWEPNTGRVFTKLQTGGTWNSPPVYTRGQELYLANYRSAYVVIII